MNVEQTLAAKTVPELIQGARDAQAAIGLIDWLEQTKDFHPGPESNSRTYQAWAETDAAERRRIYGLAKALCLAELRRRGEKS